MTKSGPTIMAWAEDVLPDRWHCDTAIQNHLGKTQGFVHPFYHTLWLLLSAGFCLMLCGTVSADDIFKPTGKYAEPVVKQSATQMTHAEMVATHNRLHGGGQWTWPGDLATHLQTAHGVNVVKTIQPVQRVQSNCPGGVCPNRPVQRVTRQRGFFRWRR